MLEIGLSGVTSLSSSQHHSKHSNIESCCQWGIGSPTVSIYFIQAASWLGLLEGKVARMLTQLSEGVFELCALPSKSRRSKARPMNLAWASEASRSNACWSCAPRKTSSRKPRQPGQHHRIVMKHLVSVSAPQTMYFSAIGLWNSLTRDFPHPISRP